MTTIVSAAVLDDRTGKVYEGRRHFDPIMGAAIDEDLDSSHIHYRHLIQGFVDSDGAFVNRRAAWIIALKAGQIFQLVGSQSWEDEHPELFSENVW